MFVRAVNEHSSFTRVMEDAYIFQDEDVKHVEQFVTNFRPSTDQYMELGACSRPQHHQHSKEAWTIACVSCLSRQAIIGIYKAKDRARCPFSFGETFLRSSCVLRIPWYDSVTHHCGLVNM